MVKSRADDEELRRECAAAVEGTKEKIVMSIRVVKIRVVWGKAGKLGRQMAKARVLALSTKAKVNRTKAFLQVLKYSNGDVLEGFDNLRSQSVAPPPQLTMTNLDDRKHLLPCRLQ